jgi:hypothetical protein
VREPALAGFLVFRPDVIPDVNCDNGNLVVLMNDQGKAIVNDEFLVGDFRYT